MLLVVACRPDEAGAEQQPRADRDRLAGAAAHAARAQPARGRRAARRRAGARAGGGVHRDLPRGQRRQSRSCCCELARTLAAEEIDPAAEQAPRVRELAPERVTRTVQLRLARLSPEAQAVARAVVVLGDDADGRLVGRAGRARRGRRRARRPTSCAPPRSSTRTRRCASSTRSCARRSTPSCRPASARRRTRARWSCCAHAARARSGSRRIWSRPRPAASARRPRRCWRRAGGARERRSALGDRLPDAGAARAGAGRPAPGDPRARSSPPASARPIARCSRRSLPELSGGAGARRPTCIVRWGIKREHVDDPQRSRRRCDPVPGAGDRGRRARRATSRAPSAWRRSSALVAAATAARPRGRG